MVGSHTECTRTASDIALQTGRLPKTVFEHLTLLQRVGAVTRVKRGRTKIITVTPEAASCGEIGNHAETVDRYRAEVLPLR